MIDCLISSLYTFFKDINYLQVLVHCLKWLVSISLNIIISKVLKRIFFKKKSGTSNLTYEYKLEIEKLYTYAIRYFFDMPREINTKNGLPKLTITVDKIIFWEFAKFGNQLEFKFSKITKLKEHLYSIIITQSLSSKHLLSKSV